MPSCHLKKVLWKQGSSMFGGTVYHGLFMPLSPFNLIVRPSMSCNLSWAFVTGRLISASNDWSTKSETPPGPKHSCSNSSGRKYDRPLKKTLKKPPAPKDCPSLLFLLFGSRPLVPLCLDSSPGAGGSQYRPLASVKDKSNHGAASYEIWPHHLRMERKFEPHLRAVIHWIQQKMNLYACVCDSPLVDKARLMKCKKHEKWQNAKAWCGGRMDPNQTRKPEQPCSPPWQWQTNKHTHTHTKGILTQQLKKAGPVLCRPCKRLRSAVSLCSRKWFPLGLAILGTSLNHSEDPKPHSKHIDLMSHGSSTVACSWA